MAIIEERVFQPLAHEDDPDDFRPDSELAIVVDPSDGGGRFCARLAVFHERIAQGDRIPLHQHTVEEVLFVDEGRIEARVGDTRRVVGAGATVFVPARTPHGFENVGGGAWPGSTRSSPPPRSPSSIWSGILPPAPKGTLPARRWPSTFVNSSRAIHRGRFVP